MSSSYS